MTLANRPRGKWATPYALMLIGPYPKDDLSAIGEKFAALADMTFETTEARIVRDYLRKSPITLSGETAQIDIPNSAYRSFISAAPSPTIRLFWKLTY